MPYVGTDFGATDPGALEEDVYSFDFAARLGPGETLSDAGTWALSSPSDSLPSSRMIGLPALSGTIVSQTIGGLLAGAALPDFVGVVEDGIALIEGIDFRVDFALGQLTRLVTWPDGTTVYPRSWRALPIAATYGAGFKVIPADVGDAVLRMVKARWFARTRDPLLRSENIPGVREAQWWVATGDQAGNLTPDVVEILNSYRVPTVI